MGRLLWLVLGGVWACGGVINGAPDGGDSGGTPPTTTVETFAIQTLFLGETTRTGSTLSNTAWKDFGYNLDGLATINTSTNVCTLAAGAPHVQTDGNNGIDNSWGSNILPIIQSAASLPTPSQTVTQSIDTGAYTLELTIAGLSDDPTQSSTGLHAEVFAGGAYDSGVPAFDSTTDWPVLASSLADGQTIAGGARTTFDAASVTNGTFVASSPTQTLTLTLVFQGAPLDLVIHHPIISFDHTSPTTAGNGTIAGVLDTNEFISNLKATAGRISTSLCGSAFDGIAQQIEIAQDILSDATNAPGQACSAISIGLGFTAARIHNPTKVAPVPTLPPNPCP